MLHLSLVTVFIRSILELFFSLDENYKLNNLLAKEEKVLAFLSVSFFNLL